jgi:hypothetical protein
MFAFEVAESQKVERRPNRASSPWRLLPSKFAFECRRIVATRASQGAAPMRILLLLVLASFLSAMLLGLPCADAQTAYHVRPGATGANNGSDWTNAYTSLPTTLARGAVYYLADGSYGSYTFNTPNSASTLITIKKATLADHGTSTGWSDSYGDGQAVFTSWAIYTDYYLIDGQRRNSDWYNGTLDQYGIKVSGNQPVRLDNGGGTGGDNLTFRYVDIQGGGRDTGSGDDVIYGLTGNSNITFQYCALHDSDRTIFLMRGNWQNLTIDHSYMARNTSTPAIHGELMSLTDATNLVVSNNVIADIEGTGVICGLNGGTLQGAKIYGNLIYHSQNYIATRSGRANYGNNGIIFVANDASNNNYGNNIAVHNNTFLNLKGLWSGVHIEAGSGNTAYNNIWWGSVRPAHTGVTTDYNYYYNTSPTDDSGAHTQSGSAGLFVSTSDPPNLRLTSATNAGMNLGSPYNIDMDGNSRGSDGTWDRGAYEYGGSQPSAPSAPSSLTVK